MRLPDVDTGRLSELKYKFQIGSKHGWGEIREFKNDTDGPAFLERELMRLGVVG